MTLDDVMRVVIGFTIAYDDMPPTEKDVRAAVEQCIAEQVAEIAAERNALRAFAQGVMESWPDGDVDGGYLQDMAEQHGLLKPETFHEACGEDCRCLQYFSSTEWQEGVTCYHQTPLLTGEQQG